MPVGRYETVNMIFAVKWATYLPEQVVQNDSLTGIKAIRAAKNTLCNGVNMVQAKVLFLNFSPWYSQTTLTCK